jgi:hypothetical protein
VSFVFDAVFWFLSSFLTAWICFWFWVIRRMDLRVAEPLRHGASFGIDALIPGLPDEVVLSVLWPKMVAPLYFLNGSTPKAEVCDIVQRIMRLRLQSQRWKRAIDSSLEGMAVRTTLHFAKLFSSADESWSHYFQRQFRSTASLLSGTWVVQDYGDLNLSRHVDWLSGDRLQDLVVRLRKAKRTSKANLCELLWYYIYNPPARTCSFEYLKPLLGDRRAYLGFQSLE